MTKVIHGMYGTPIYDCYLAMKKRCYNKNSKNYHRYGGRGITVCKRWLENFINFYNDMGEKPTQKHSLDRINNDGNYELSNCRWANSKENSNNRSNTVYVKYNNKITSLSYLAEKHHINYFTLSSRILESKMDINTAIEKPVQKKLVTYEFNGEHLPIKDWAVRYGIKYATLRKRILVSNMPMQKALTMNLWNIS